MKGRPGFISCRSCGIRLFCLMVEPRHNPTPAFPPLPVPACQRIHLLRHQLQNKKTTPSRFGLARGLPTHRWCCVSARKTERGVVLRTYSSRPPRPAPHRPPLNSHSTETILLACCGQLHCDRRWVQGEFACLGPC